MAHLATQPGTLTSRRALVAGGILAIFAAPFAPARTLAKDGTLKKFKLSAEQIRPIATGRGGAYASDDIMVAGKQIGYMYREQPDNSGDSGWRFLSGQETDPYMDDASKFGFYDVNTIANYGPEIIPLLDSPIGSAYVRGPNGLTLDPDGPPTPK